MTRYGLDLAPEFGDLYVYAEPGTSLFPNDFHQPLASKTLALLDWQQRPRFRDPRHRGDHGYRPDNPCENGFLLLVDQGFAASDRTATLLEVAPSILWLLDLPQPGTMRGRSVFRKADTPARARIR